jgi:hypothetical protein
MRRFVILPPTPKLTLQVLSWMLSTVAGGTLGFALMSHPVSANRCALRCI